MRESAHSFYESKKHQVRNGIMAFGFSAVLAACGGGEDVTATTPETTTMAPTTTEQVVETSTTEAPETTTTTEAAPVAEDPNLPGFFREPEFANPSIQARYEIFYNEIAANGPIELTKGLFETQLEGNWELAFRLWARNLEAVMNDYQLSIVYGSEGEYLEDENFFVTSAFGGASDSMEVADAWKRASFFIQNHKADIGENKLAENAWAPIIVNQFETTTDSGDGRTVTANINYALESGDFYGDTTWYREDPWIEDRYGFSEDKIYGGGEGCEFGFVDGTDVMKLGICENIIFNE